MKIVVAALAALAVAGCSSSTSAEPSAPENVEVVAHRLDVLAAKGDAQAAYDLYSQRCQNKIGTIADYKKALELFFEGRNPNYVTATATVDGSSAQVVSIDSDPTAPASAKQPRTWTLIDGRWQFDNC